MQFKKREIHPVFHRFPNFHSVQNLSLSTLADLIIGYSGGAFGFYKNEKTPQNMVMSNVQRIDVQDDQLLLTDLLDRQTVVVGKLVMVDLVGGVAIVQER